LFRKTSCGVSYLKGTSDYNAHWSRYEKNCLETCPEEQRERCLSIRSPSESSVKFLLKNLGYDDIGFVVEPQFIRIEKPLQSEEKTYLRHNLSFPII